MTSAESAEIRDPDKLVQAMNLYQFFFFISLLGVFQGILLGGQFFIRKQKERSLAHLMGLLFLSGSVAMLAITLINSKQLVEWRWLHFIEYLIGLTTGPLVWLTVVKIQGKLNKRTALHFIPASLFVLQQLLFPEITQWPILIVMLHLQSYAIAALIKYLNIQKNKLSASLRKYHKWAGWLIAFYLFIGLSQWIRFSFSTYEDLNLIIPMTASIHLYIVLMVGFNRSVLWKGMEQRDKKLKPTSFSAKILEKIEQEKLYLQEGLSLGELAVLLNMPSYELSHLLNQEVQGGFTTYINNLRIKHAQTLLTKSEYRHLSMEGIGKESGFQSRSAFYHYFKKECLMTPSAYQKKMSGI